MSVKQNAGLYAGAFCRFVIAVDLPVKEWLEGVGMHVVEGV